MVNKDFIDFIEIGTSDFDTEIQKIDNKTGISIDAVKFYIDRLPDKKNCIKINNGISDYNGIITINYVSLENIRKYNLPNWVRGCNSVNNYHPTVTKLLLNKGVNIKDIVTSYEVPCKTLIDIIKENNINGLYFLKIDTEGHDTVILEHFFNNYKNNKYLPHKILFESNVLTAQNKVKNIITLSNKIGYDLISSGGDTILKLNLKNIIKQNIFTDQINNYYILEEYPKNYNPNNLPHKNTLEDAKKYCIEYNCTGITYINNKYEVRNGKYINYSKNNKLKSWLYI